MYLHFLVGKSIGVIKTHAGFSCWMNILEEYTPVLVLAGPGADCLLFMRLGVHGSGCHSASLPGPTSHKSHISTFPRTFLFPPPTLRVSLTDNCRAPTHAYLWCQSLSSKNPWFGCVFVFVFNPVYPASVTRGLWCLRMSPPFLPDPKPCLPRV